MSGFSNSVRTDAPTESSAASEAEFESGSHGDLASLSDELTDALQAATCYVEAVRKIAADRPSVVDRDDHDVLVLAMGQITRANRAVKHLHRALKSPLN